MENLTDKEWCFSIQTSIGILEQQKKDEVMKCVGQFVLNDKIQSINKQIAMLQQQCKHLDLEHGKCIYCKKQIESIR